MIRRLLITCRQYAPLALWGCGDTALAYWYLPERLSLCSSREATDYFGCLADAEALPKYPMDYTAKCRFSGRSLDGLVLLPYGGAIGAQFNPEAAALELLGRWQCALSSNAIDRFDDFLVGATALASRMDQNGRLGYGFQWGSLEPPWYSALAQSRAASVFLRASRCSQDSKYLTLCSDCFKCFSVSEWDGGVGATDLDSRIPFPSEFARSPIGVLNGLMATAIGLAECNRAAIDMGLSPLLRGALMALREFIPRCEVHDWSLYQFSGPDWRWNIQSPRYHRMCVAYLRVLGVLTEDEWFVSRANRWDHMLSTRAVCSAYWRKAIFKLLRR